MSAPNIDMLGEDMTEVSVQDEVIVEDKAVGRSVAVGARVPGIELLQVLSRDPHYLQLVGKLHDQALIGLLRFAITQFFVTLSDL